jgi:cobalt-zinc-cadmium efflux system membrane fusion protein
MMRWYSILLVLSFAGALAGCKHSAPDGTGPETEETQSAVGFEVRANPNAQAAIGLTTTTAEKRDVRQSILATGWLAARPASEIVVKAPTTGYVTFSEEKLLALGDSVTKDQPLAMLHVFLSPQEQAQLVNEKEDADTLIEQSQTTAELAEAQLKRLEENASTAVSGTRLNELREMIAHSRAAEQSAREKLPFMPTEPYDNGVGLSALPVKAPLDGHVVNMHVAPRQLVVQGDPLWTVADWSRLWIRAPVYAMSLSRIAEREPATATVLGGKQAYMAQPVNVIQPTEPGKQTIELIYEVENPDGKLRPGQAMSISLPAGAQVAEIVIPRAAVLWDGMGNSWVYAKTPPSTFHRRRIELGQFLGDDVVVRRGIKEGEEIVTTGAEALYGEEFKGQLQVEDDD